MRRSLRRSLRRGGRAWVGTTGLWLAACMPMPTGGDETGPPPGARADAAPFLWCDASGDSPLAATLVGRPLEAAFPYTARAGVLVDIAEIAPDGSASLLAIETPDILTFLHRGGMIDSVSCIPRDLCSGPRRGESALCRA